MTLYQYRFLAGALAWALALPATAQEYRYQSAEDPARQTVEQQQPAAPPQPAPAQQAAPAVPTCATCGTVDAIRIVEQAGEGSGLGMIAGGVVGGLLGNQIGRGRGNTAATIAGAAGGAYAGHQVEKNVKKNNRYDVNVRMDDGTMRTVSYDVEPGFRSGDKVRFVDGRLVRN